MAGVKKSKARPQGKVTPQSGSKVKKGGEVQDQVQGILYFGADHK